MLPRERPVKCRKAVEITPSRKLPPRFFLHARRNDGGLSSLCARQGALTSWLKSDAHPARGSASRTARVSVVRSNLKEAVGKTLA